MVILFVQEYGGVIGYFAADALFVDDGTDWADKTIYRCNLMEYLRTITTFGSKYVYVYKGQGAYTTYTNSEDVDKGDSIFMGYAILYLLLVIETMMFLFTYLKRVFKLAFYTMIAPLIAFMYPIDKLGDGKAQAFNTWFKEYMYNVLIQPLHLLLYTVFIYSAMELMNESVIYAIGAYAYMIAAEKFFKKIFGFDKAPTGAPGGLANPAVGHAAMRGLDKLAGVGPGAKGGKGGKGENSYKTKVPKLASKKPGSGTPASMGGLSGGSGGESGVPGSSGGGTSGSIPGADGNRSGMGFWGAARQNASRNIARKITGGKSGSLGSIYRSKDHKMDVLKTAGKFGAKKLAKGVGAAAGGALGLGAGLLAGTIASAVTGENQLGKGVYAGTKVGLNRGAQLGDWAANGAGNWYKEAKRQQATDPNNTGLAADLRLSDLQTQYSDITDGMSEDELSRLHDVLEYGDIKSEDGLKAARDAIRNDSSASAENIFEAVNTQENMGDLSDEKNFNKAVGYEMRNGDLIDDPEKDSIKAASDSEVEQEFRRREQEQRAQLQEKVNESDKRDLSDSELQDMLKETQDDRAKLLRSKPQPAKERNLKALEKEIKEEMANRQALKDFDSTAAQKQRNDELAKQQKDTFDKKYEAELKTRAEAKVEGHRTLLKK